jgi:hypothetical protein
LYPFREWHSGHCWTKGHDETSILPHFNVRALPPGSKGVGRRVCSSEWICPKVPFVVAQIPAIPFALATQQFAGFYFSKRLRMGYLRVAAGPVLEDGENPGIAS